MKEQFNLKKLEEKTKNQIKKDDDRYKNNKFYDYGSKTGHKTNGLIDAIVDFFFKK